jgi:hypothetical protein
MDIFWTAQKCPKLGGLNWIFLIGLFGFERNIFGGFVVET